jgi:hypothetical protein
LAREHYLDITTAREEDSIVVPLFPAVDAPREGIMRFPRYWTARVEIVKTDRYSEKDPRAVC